MCNKSHIVKRFFIVVSHFKEYPHPYVSSILKPSPFLEDLYSNRHGVLSKKQCDTMRIGESSQVIPVEVPVEFWQSLRTTSGNSTLPPLR
jgi:hypothetical protein